MSPTGELGARGGEPGAGPIPSKGQVEHTRTEFIILFIWREPTPSDVLRGETDSSPTAPAAAPR
jgi:hypothetical protein